MEELRINLENCYGIKKLEAKFSFSRSNAVAIYAPNGSMKSSFAQTFQDIADAEESRDRIFPDRKTIRSVTDEAGDELLAESVVVIKPYDEVLGHTEETSMLLVDTKLRSEYEALHKDIEQSKALLITALKEQSGSKRNIESEVSATFTSTEDEFYVALVRIQDELKNQTEAPFADFQYDTVFDEKVLNFLNTKDFKDAVKEYVERYNELLDESTYFQRGVFTHHNASTIAKNLADNGFFDAHHQVRLHGDEEKEIATKDELEQLIEEDRSKISDDEDLRRKFADIEKQLNRNVNMRAFYAYIQENDFLLPHLSNPKKLKEDVWKSYLFEKFDLYTDLVSKHLRAEARKREIEKLAADQRTEWEEVIRIFNQRFFVPFTLVAANRTAVVLGRDSLLTLEFVFDDGADHAPIKKNQLLQVLSTGEKKALYILNIIFEVEVRRKTEKQTLFVVDDIADSFDYKNKYAIIEYLREISETDQFKQIVLTHNFDFYRTVNSRFIPYSNCFMAARADGTLSLHKAEGIKNIFVNDWKPAFFTDSKKKIASIPFIRNLVEYTKGDADPLYSTLTSLLHVKADSDAIKIGDLDDIYNAVFGDDQTSDDSDVAVADLISSAADECLEEGDGANFEHKIVLAIATRLAAERFMKDRINDPGFVDAIESNQTAALLRRFCELEQSTDAEKDTLQRVVLMTPENIHLNSFMYEPILDMSDEHLRRLYREVNELQAAV